MFRNRSIVALLSLMAACSSSGSFAPGPVTCEATAKISNQSFDAEIENGFIPNDFLSQLELSNQRVVFEWRSYSEADISSTSPPTGGTTNAYVTITRSSGLPRFYERTKSACRSYVKIDVDYSIITDDGLLNEQSNRITLTTYLSENAGDGQLSVEDAEIGGKLRASYTSAIPAKLVFGLALNGGMPTGGILLRTSDVIVDSGTMVRQTLLGRWY